MSVHAPPTLMRLFQSFTILALVASLLLWIVSRPWAWSGVTVIALLHLGWYLTLTPRADRDWAPDMARITTGSVENGIARLSDVRAFTWAEGGEVSEAIWRDGIYDLSRIERVDLLTSSWGHPDIAHIIVTFHFDDGGDLAWSIEARREVGESFNGPGGFLRQFELAVVAAPESDVIDLRVESRGETVRRFPTTLTPEQGAILFRRYIELGNTLDARPRFYNIVFGNCTTVAWSLAHALRADLPLHSGLVLSGRLPEYLDELGVLPGDVPMSQRREEGLLRPRSE
ncbi:DUF4105 domain-containing protein [Jannaschia aquimarina]|nr:DUF4105 domain-containing protein [Jannaschia aquimarina]